jgi:hypothetical protein
MNKRFKKAIPLFFLGLLLAPFIALITSKPTYELLTTNNRKFEKIFANPYSEKIKVNSSFCDENDTLYNLEIDNNRMTIWKLSRYKNLKTKDIKIDSLRIINGFYFTAYSEIEVNKFLKIKYKFPDTRSENITLNISKHSQLISTLYYKQNTGYHLRTSKIKIGDSKNRGNIIFDFGNESREVIFMLLNDKEQFFLLLYYPYNDEPIKSNYFIKMLN